MIYNGRVRKLEFLLVQHFQNEIYFSDDVLLFNNIFISSCHLFLLLIKEIIDN